MRYVVDRIEEGIAVLENESSEHINVCLSDLPSGVRDGSILMLKDGHYELDMSAEEKRRAEMFQKQQHLLKKNK